MQKKMITAVAFLALAVGTLSATAQIATWDWGGNEVSFGALAKLEYIHQDRESTWEPGFSWVPPVVQDGPAVGFFRLRTYAWLDLKLGMDANVVFKLGNEMRHYTSHWRTPNNNSTPTYEFLDEIYIDNLYLDMKNMGGTDWSMRLGRQSMHELGIGNGMVMFDGTPGDAGRSTYADGALLKHETECGVLKLMAFYQGHEDYTVIINDSERLNNISDIVTLAADYKYRFGDTGTTLEAYAIYNGLDEYYSPYGMGNDPDFDADMYTFGGIFYASPYELVDGSIEVAKQLGEADDTDLDGWLVDARVNFKTPEGTIFAPVFTLEYTHFSGDDTSSGDFEGWVPLQSQWPIWREEMTPYHYIFPAAGMPGASFPAAWSNMNRYRAQAVLKLAKAVRFTGAYDLMTADEDDALAGDQYGHVLSSFLDYQASDKLGLGLEVCGFFAGDAYAAGEDGEWIKVRAIYRF